MLEPNHNRWKTLIRVLCCTLFLLAGAGVASAVEFYIPALKAPSGQAVDVPLMIDEVENMAGLKVVMKYDPKLLTFQKGIKTKHADSLMHIINDKKPGVLIVVMAGARGIKGREFAVMNLWFETRGGLQADQATTIEITEIEMMSDQLKDVPCAVKTNPLVILPEPAGTERKVDERGK